MLNRRRNAFENEVWLAKPHEAAISVSEDEPLLINCFARSSRNSNRY